MKVHWHCTVLLLSMIEVAAAATSHGLDGGIVGGTLAAGNSGKTISVTQQREVSPLATSIPGGIEVTDSIPPADDLAMPFGTCAVGTSWIKTVTIGNRDDLHDLTVTDIKLKYSYSENFNDSQAQLWTPNFEGDWSVMGGEYRAFSSMPRIMQSVYARQSWADLDFSATIRRAGNRSADVGLFLRASDDFDMQTNTGSALCVMIDGNQKLRVIRYTKGALKYLLDYTTTPYLNAGAVANSIAVSARGTETKVYLNQYLAWTGTDDSEPGRIGLAGYSNNGQDTYYFDNVRVGPPGPFPGAEPAFSLSYSLSSLSIPPGGSIKCYVRFFPLTVQSWSDAILIESTDKDEPEVEIKLSGKTIEEPLVLTPNDEFVTMGGTGGPYHPPSKEYLLKNASGLAVSWKAKASEPWVSIVPAGGVLSANDQVEATISIGADPGPSPNPLQPGSFSAQVFFTDITFGSVLTRNVKLTIDDNPRMRIETPTPLDIELLPDENVTLYTGVRIYNDGVSNLEYIAVPQNQGGPAVAVLGADAPAMLADVQAKLLMTEQFSSVTTFDVGSATPALNQLKAFDALLVFGYHGYIDRYGLGDVVAGYAAGGKGVVCAVFEVGYATIRTAMQGDWVVGGHTLMDRAEHVTGAASLGRIYEPSHFLMNGVYVFDGGDIAPRPATYAAHTGADIVATWSDRHPLVVCGAPNGTRRVDLGFYPPSSDVSPNGWKSWTHGDKLMANALLWVSGRTEGAMPQWLLVKDPVTGVVPPFSYEEKWINFDAKGLAPRKYTSSIYIAGNGAHHSFVSIPVTLDVGNHWRGFKKEPLDGKRYSGERHTVSVQVDCGQSWPDYRWMFRDASGNATMIGGNHPFFTIPMASTANNGSYWCEVTYDNKTYLSKMASFSVEDHLAITRQPVGAFKQLGGAHEFSVETTGGFQPLHYTWFKDHQSIAGATGPDWLLNPLGIMDSGKYSVEVADDNTDVDVSAPAFLRVGETLPVQGPVGLVLLVLAVACAGAYARKR